MAEFESLLNKLLDTFFHLPTLIGLMLVAAGAVGWVYDIGLDVGDGFIRLSSSQGTINVYWLNGCCQLDW